MRPVSRKTTSAPCRLPLLIGGGHTPIRNMDFLSELLLRLVFLPIEALLEWVLESAFKRYLKLAAGLIGLFTLLFLALARRHFGTLVWYAWLLAPMAAMLCALPLIGIWHVVGRLCFRPHPSAQPPKQGKRRKR